MLLCGKFIQVFALIHADQYFAINGQVVLHNVVKSCHLFIHYS